jgi:pimeloyl-ACP methyl ester carboxylesterase
MRRAALSDVDLSYVRRGQGTDVVLVHGLGADLSFWFLAGLPALARDHRVTAWDLRGHGRSGMPPSGYTTAQMADDLRGLLDHLEVERVDVVGHSFGGAVGLHLAVLHPERVRSLILADACVPALQGDQRLEDWPEWPAYRAELERAGVPPIDGERTIGLELLADLAQRHPGDITKQPRAGDVFIPFGRPGRRSAGDRWLRLVHETTALQELPRHAGMTRDAIRRVATPTLALFGERSPFLQTLVELQRELPDCRPSVVPGVGHFHPVRRPRAFEGHARRFLSEQQP